MTDAVSFRVKLNHGKSKHKFQIIRGEPFEEFQARVYSITNVPPERQTIVLKGKQITCSEDMTSIKKKSTIFLQGSADQTIQHVPEAERTRFLEDLTEAEKHEALAILPPGLENLGNTCYLNSTLQCIKAIPEVKDALKQKGFNEAGGAPPGGMVALQPFSPELGKLFIHMESTSEAFVPHEFVRYFRLRFPRFASVDEKTRAYQQQDAGEVFTEMMSLMRTEMTTGDGNVIDQVMEGTIHEVLTVEATGETQESDQTFDRLQCFITQETRGVVDGIMKGFQGEIEKRSASGENAIWKKNSMIVQLPKYIPVQLMRFEYRTDVNKATKITRRVVFPDRMDVYQLVSPEMRGVIGQYRRKLIEYEDAEREKRQAMDVDESANTGGDDAKTQSASSSNKQGAQPMDVDPATDEKQAEAEAEVELTRENACTGYYSLFAMVAHKGQSANSGHYIGYAKDEKRGWLKFDDDFVSEVPEEKIKDLYGGLAQWQMGYLCFYKQVEPNLAIFDSDSAPTGDSNVSAATE